MRLLSLDRMKFGFKVDIDSASTIGPQLSVVCYDIMDTSDIRRVRRKKNKQTNKLIVRIAQLVEIWTTSHRLDPQL